MDGLRVSDYLKEIAVKHIEGDITIDEVRKQLQSYYVNKITHDADDAEKEEADRVAANITKLLNEQSFSLTPLAFLNIHRHLFEGIFKHAGVAVGHLDIIARVVSFVVSISLRTYREKLSNGWLTGTFQAVTSSSTAMASVSLHVA